MRGFRFDAVKHMRPEHLAELLSYVRQSGQACFAYGEVLTPGRAATGNLVFLQMAS